MAFMTLNGRQEKYYFKLRNGAIKCRGRNYFVCTAFVGESHYIMLKGVKVEVPLRTYKNH